MLCIYWENIPPKKKKKKSEQHKQQKYSENKRIFILTRETNSLKKPVTKQNKQTKNTVKTIGYLYPQQSITFRSMVEKKKNTVLKNQTPIWKKSVNCIWNNHFRKMTG